MGGGLARILNIGLTIGHGFKRAQYVSPLFLVALTVSAICLTSPMSVVNAHSGLTLSAYTPTPPNIDGIIQPDEWAAAATATFGPILIDSQTITGTLYMMNDALNLYAAVIVNGDDDLGIEDQAILDFDNDNGGETEH
ncbi:MAG: hypothetical protein QXE22_07525, partial [Candidatus Bathyarchaeia archaeon]